jgi:hypothetical protein
VGRWRGDMGERWRVVAGTDYGLERDYDWEGWFEGGMDVHRCEIWNGLRMH